MLKWLLIISITMVSTSMLIFASAFLAVLQEAQLYYQVDRTSILLLSNSFNILYLVITPCIFFALKKHYSILVYISAVLTAIGCVGRYFCNNNFTISLLMSTLVAAGHIPIITAPYGLLDLFPQSQKGYAASIPLFLPTLGINFSIYFGMSFISNSVPIQIFKQINNLNLIIAILGTISCLSTIFLLKKLRKQIRKVNQQSQTQQYISLKQVYGSFKNVNKVTLITKLVSWGIILGLNWTYGGMFQVFLSNNGMSNKNNALVGLYANLSSVAFSNLGTWISNKCGYSNKSIIFILNVFGLIASIIISLTTMQSVSILKGQIPTIISIIVLRAGFSSFVSLALIQLGHSFSPVLVSSIFFYIANAANLGGNLLVDKVATSLSLLIMSFVIWFCIVCIEISYFKDKLNGKKQERKQVESKIQQHSNNIHQIDSIEDINQEIKYKQKLKNKQLSEQKIIKSPEID